MGDEEVIIQEAGSVRRIVSLHISGTKFNYLKASEFNFGNDVDVSFIETLGSICDAMRISSISEDSALLQKLADRSERFDRLMNSSDIESSIVQENLPEGNTREDDDGDDVEADEEENNDEQVSGENEVEGEIGSLITRIPIDSESLRDCSFKVIFCIIMLNAVMFLGLKKIIRSIIINLYGNNNDNCETFPT